uniref:Uncharacterized protein n=1 Tax=Brassica oleracea TaxID=3712 RepID=A0A3P6DG66_BRAOL|nr:unnamed protein product [Brassica oleracea]
MYLSCLKNLPVNLPGLFLSPSPFSSEEKTLPPFPLPLERDDSSASLPSVCFSFFIGLLSCGAVSTGPENATEITSIMGNCLAKPPPVVLVPPLFDYPPLSARNRMLESSYDFLFGKLALKCLFEDYFEVSSAVDGKVEGDASFRWQSDADDPHTFVDLSVVLRVRSSGFCPKYGIGAFLVSPLISKKNDKLSDEHGIMGLRYASTNLSLGAIVSPFSTKQINIYFFLYNFLFTFFLDNADPLNPHSSKGRMAKECMAGKKDGKTYSRNTEKYRDVRNWSCAASYGLGSRSPLNPSFNVGLELTRNSQIFSPNTYHIVIQLDIIYCFVLSTFSGPKAGTALVKNPFEENKVVGITNYIDLGFELQTR